METWDSKCCFEGSVQILGSKILGAAGWVGGWGGDWEEGAPNHSLAGMCEIFQGRGCEPPSPGACESPWDQPSELTPKGLRAGPARFWEVFLRATYAQTYAQGVPTKNRFRGAKEH